MPGSPHTGGTAISYQVGLSSLHAKTKKENVGEFSLRGVCVSQAEMQRKLSCVDIAGRHTLRRMSGRSSAAQEAGISA